MGIQNDYLTFILFTCLLSSSLVFIANANEPEVDDETGFSYVLGAPDGPGNWSNLNPNWTKCGSGMSQSPIDIVDNSAVLSPSLGGLNKTYKPAPAVIKNRGRDIEVKWTGDAGGIIINGTAFKLDQCHWHIPSEHTVNGVGYAMELHAVHISPQKEIAVVGILYRLGLPDPFLIRLSPFLATANSNGTNIGVVNPYDVGFPGHRYYRYNGSLTTPPCSENVTWTVYKTVKTVASWQIQQLRDAVNDNGTGNARPVQPLNGRTVHLYKPDCWFIFCK